MNVTELFEGAAGDITTGFTQIFSTHVRRDGSGFGSYLANGSPFSAYGIVADGTFTDIQFSEVVVKRVTAGGGFDETVAPMVRCNGTNTNLYWVICDGATYLGQRKYTGGAGNGNLGNGTGDGTLTLADGDVVRLVANGSALSLYKQTGGAGSFVLVTTWTDANLSTGSPGLAFYSNAASALPALVYSWTGGDGVAPSAGPLTATATDGMKMGDTAAGRYPSQVVSVTDGMKMGEDVTVTMITDTGPDGMKMGDTATATYKRHVVSQTDGMKMGDTASSTVSRLVASQTDGMKMGDTVTPVLIAGERAATDGMRMGDIVVTTYKRHVASALDGMRMGDTLRDTTSHGGGGITSIKNIRGLRSVLL